MSDSECEIQARPIVVEKAPKKPAAATKRKSPVSKTPSEPKLRATSSKGEALFGDLFGLEDEIPPPSTSGELTSSLVNRVANGKVRRTADLTGAYFVELKVYNTKEIAHTPAQDRWKKAEVAMKVLMEKDTPHWDSLQKFMLRAHKLFDASEPVYYTDKINIRT